MIAERFTLPNHNIYDTISHVIDKYDLSGNDRAIFVGMAFRLTAEEIGCIIGRSPRYVRYAKARLRDAMGGRGKETRGGV